MNSMVEISLDELRKLGIVKTEYSQSDLAEYHIVRISYLTEEMRSAGVEIPDNSIISSHDKSAKDAERLLEVEISEANMDGIKKWQLPIPKEEHQEVIQRTSFSPKTKVAKHSHPKRGESAAFRFIISGSLSCNGVLYKAGEWFYIPPNTEYSLEAGEDGAEILHTYHAVCPRFEIDPFYAK